MDCHKSWLEEIILLLKKCWKNILYWYSRCKRSITCQNLKDFRDHRNSIIAIPLKQMRKLRPDVYWNWINEGCNSWVGNYSCQSLFHSTICSSQSSLGNSLYHSSQRYHSFTIYLFNFWAYGYEKTSSSIFPFLQDIINSLIDICIFNNVHSTMTE